MKREDVVSTAEMFALSKMDPVSKRSDNTQIILMYERLSAGRKSMEKVFDQMLENVLEESSLNLKLAADLKELDKIQHSLHDAVTSLIQSNEETRNYHEQIVKAQYETRELLLLMETELAEYQTQCKEQLPQEQDVLNRLERFSTDISRTIANNRQLYSIYTELMEHLRTGKAQMYKLEQGSDAITQITEHVKVVKDAYVGQTRQLASVSAVVGSLSQDPFYMMDNAMFRNKMLSAVTCHKEWMKRMRKMVDTKGQILEQLDEHLCGFGIIYDSIHPKNAVVYKAWNQLGTLHSKLHHTAREALSAMQVGQKEKAKMLFLDMKDISDEMISLCDGMQKAVKGLDKKKESVFLTSEIRN